MLGEWLLDNGFKAYVTERSAQYYFGFVAVKQVQVVPGVDVVMRIPTFWDLNGDNWLDRRYNLLTRRRGEEAW